MNYLQTHKEIAAISIFAFGLMLGRFPKFVLLALWAAFIAAGLICLAAMVFAAGDPVETPDEGYIKSISKKGRK